MKILDEFLTYMMDDARWIKGMFIDTNIKALTDIYDAGCSAEQEGLLMIEIDVDKNDSQVYFTGKQRLADMDKLRPAVSKTKGWIYKETDEYIITFGTYSTDINDNIIEFGEVLCIPKNWI